MKERKQTKTWERTRLQNLVRHRSGRYYARAFAGGKEVWKSLKTSHFSVAQARLAEFLKEHRQRVSNGNGEGSAKMTFVDAAEIHLRNLDAIRATARTSRWGWRSRECGRAKRTRLIGATSILKPARLLCVATPRLARRIGICAECHSFPMRARCLSGCAANAPKNH